MSVVDKSVDAMDAAELLTTVQNMDVADRYASPRLDYICQMAHADPCDHCDKERDKPCSLYAQCQSTWWACDEDCPVYLVTGQKCSEQLSGEQMIDIIRGA